MPNLRRRDPKPANAIAGSDSHIMYFDERWPFGGTSNAAVEAVVVTVSLDVAPGMTEVGLSEQPSLSLDGTEQVNDTGLLKAFCGVTEMAYAAEEPGFSVILVGDAPILKLGV